MCNASRCEFASTSLGPLGKALEYGHIIDGRYKLASQDQYLLFTKGLNQINLA
jgi:hypothetical protein